jgi:hypothetical protein
MGHLETYESGLRGWTECGKVRMMEEEEEDTGIYRRPDLSICVGKGSKEGFLR